METLVESMVYATIQQMVGFVNVPQGLLVLTAQSVRKSKKKQEYFAIKCPSSQLVYAK